LKGIPKLVNKGGSGCTPAKKCTICQGDCDRDADCAKGLRCFQRNGKTIVHGCQSGGSGDATNYDYCFNQQRLHNYGGTGCTPTKPCDACAGDCDTDSDCKAGLMCFQRNGLTLVHGCLPGTQHDTFHYDYCYSATALHNYGGTGCTAAKKCAKCAGDCDRDTDCLPGLHCFQRSNFAKVTGCATGGAHDVRHYDFCYDKATGLAREQGRLRLHGR
jgi:hypothetical protein